MNLMLRPITLVVGLVGVLPSPSSPISSCWSPPNGSRRTTLADPQKPCPCGLPDTSGDNAKLLDERLDQGHRRIEVST